MQYPLDGDRCCSNPHVVLTKEIEYVCINCGTVIAPYLINSERRAYNASEVSSRRRTEPLWRNFGNRTIIGAYTTDANGKPIMAENRTLFSRLNKIQGSLINSLERNYWEAKPKLGSLVYRLNLPDFVQETAWKIYCMAAKKKLTMGRSIEAFIAASVYASIRVHEYPRLLEEVVEAAMTSQRTVHKALGLLLRVVFPAQNLHYRPISSYKLIFRFGNDLNLPMSTQQMAKTILIEARRGGLSRIGKDPKGIAAAVLYLAAKNTPDKITQSRMAAVAHITEVTLRTRSKQIWGITSKTIPSICSIIPKLNT